MGDSMNFDCSPEHSLNVCLPALKLTKITTDNILFPYGDKLETIYPVLEKILSYLPYCDLLSASTVNKNWNEIASSILRKRHNITWFHLKQKHEQMILEKSLNLNYENTNFVFLIYNYRNIKLTKFVCVHNETKTAERKTLWEYFEENFLIPHTNYCILSTSCLYPLFSEAENTHTWFSGITIPKINNVRIAINSHIEKRNETVNVFNLKNDEKYICLLVLTIGYPYKTIDNFVSNLLKEHSRNTVAFCGGVASGLKSSNFDNKFSKKHFLCIGFIEYAASNCQTYSIVIKDEDDFEKKVLNFKNNIKILKNSIIIRITCTEKQNKNSETPILHKHFENIPIMGMDANGEFGWNKYENLTQSDCKDAVKLFSSDKCDNYLLNIAKSNKK